MKHYIKPQEVKQVRKKGLKTNIQPDKSTKTKDIKKKPYQFTNP